MALSSRTQRTFLLSFIFSLCACGVIGIYVLLVGSFGILEGRVLGSTAALGGASILAMASAIAWEARRWPIVGVMGMILSGVALLILLALIWHAIPSGLGDFPWQLCGTGCVLAVACAHVALLALARLHRGYEWIRLGTVGTIAVLAGLILFMIWYEPLGAGIWRFIGVLGILDACGTIATPVLHRISRIRAGAETVTTELVLTITCPRCGKTQQQPAGPSRCACGLRFKIEIEEEHCPKCGYSLYRLTGNHCPECGTLIAAPDAATKA